MCLKSSLWKASNCDVAMLRTCCIISSHCNKKLIKYGDFINIFSALIFMDFVVWVKNQNFYWSKKLDKKLFCFQHSFISLKPNHWKLMPTNTNKIILCRSWISIFISQVIILLQELHFILTWSIDTSLFISTPFFNFLEIIQVPGKKLNQKWKYEK